MPIPPKSYGFIPNTSITQTTGGGRVYPTTSNKIQNPPAPVPNPPVLVGVDVISVTIPGSGQATVTSPNIPGRSNGYVPPNSRTVEAQGTSSVIVVAGVQAGAASCYPFAVDVRGISHSGSILSNNTFRAFGANISGTPGQSVTISITVYYQR